MAPGVRGAGGQGLPEGLLGVGPAAAEVQAVAAVAEDLGVARPELQGPGEVPVGAGAVPLDRLAWPALSGIRLDPVLVEGVWREERRATVVECLLELVAKSGLEAIADGVDHPEQVEWLAARRAVAVAGPLVGETMAVAALQDRLGSARPLQHRRTF